ncbi:NAD(P)/FAD-dependent oxidoreductase [Streptomyces pinistramenti]|uniref:NAD(P)/FAD-dependent oxidoreductase n=1 Tax=Streptomyces pinistramenti TaxID=2884812 RepID=UPI001D08AAB8|nr:FAD-binding oxidoreductase [Streptomyces pinistramenti]MCB5907773.1 FAD-binding oxidoreductase [Streptomyces pinistramenti]
MSRVLVIGAGVLGASVAHHLARAGAEVTVIDAGGPASGTSSATFSIDVTHLKTPYSYYELNRRSAAAHLTLGEELGGAAWRHQVPLVQWGHTPHERRVINERAQRLRSWGHACRTTGTEALAELAPGADPAACAAPELVVHDHAAWYDAPLLARALLDRAALNGAAIRYGLRVTALLRRGDRVVGVATEGRRWEADHVINCAGPEAGRIAALADVSLPLTRIPGLVGESTPVPAARLGAILATPGVDLRPAPGDRVCSISWPVDALLPADGDTGREQQPGLEEELHRRGGEVLPALRTAGLTGVRRGVRPVPADGLPLVGTVPGADGLYSVVTHSGVTLAPLLGELAAEEVLSGRAVPALAPYRPSREPAADVQDESVQVMSNQQAAAE